GRGVGRNKEVPGAQATVLSLPDRRVRPQAEGGPERGNRGQSRPPCLQPLHGLRPVEGVLRAASSEASPREAPGLLGERRHSGHHGRLTWKHFLVISRSFRRRYLASRPAFPRQNGTLKAFSTAAHQRVN